MTVIRELQYAVALEPLAEIWKTETNGGFGIDIDVETHLRDMQSLIDREDAELFCLCDADGTIVGYLGVVLFDNPIGQGKCSSEHYWYVHPEHRGIGSMKLLHTAKEWAKDRGCTHIIFNASKLASELHDTVCRMYERLGMKHFETSYICEVT